MARHNLSATQQLVIEALAQGPADPGTISKRAALYHGLRRHTITAMLNREVIQIDGTDPDADYADTILSLTAKGRRIAVDLLGIESIATPPDPDPFED